MKKKFLLALFFIAVIGCQSTRYAKIKETPSMTDLPQYSIEEAEKIARIKIPASATEIQVHTETGWMDDLALIKFKLPADELDSFLDAHGFHNLKKGYWPFQDFQIPGDWWPNTKSSLEGAIYLGETRDFPGFTQKILIDVTNKDVYIIYLACFDI